MDLVLATYAIYIVLSVALTVWLGRTLHSNGKPFLERVFRQDVRFADSVNHLLIVGFYMVNLGYVLTQMHMYGANITERQMMEWLGTKVGGVALMLGAMHFMNMFIFSRIWGRNGGMELLQKSGGTAGGVETSSAVPG